MNKERDDDLESGAPDPSWEGPEDFDIDRPVDDEGGPAWLIIVGRLALALIVALLVISLFADIVFGIFRRTGDALPGTRQPDLIEAGVGDIMDGPAVGVEIESARFVVRYIGVETPPPGAPFHELARLTNERWVADKDVLLEQDVTDYDAEGRLLRHVHVDGAMANAGLIAAGHGRHLPEPPDTRYALLFDELEADARQRGAGIWEPLMARDRAAPPHP